MSESKQPAVKEKYPELWKAVGAPEYVETDSDVSASINLLSCHNLPLGFCHSFNPARPVSDANQPTVQGGLLCGALDNAMTVGVMIASGGRFVSTLEMRTQFLRPCRAGRCYVTVDVTRVTGRTAFANAKLFADEARTVLVATASSTNKLRPPPKESAASSARL